MPFLFFGTGKCTPWGTHPAAYQTAAFWKPAKNREHPSNRTLWYMHIHTNTNIIYIHILYCTYIHQWYLLVFGDLRFFSCSFFSWLCLGATPKSHGVIPDCCVEIPVFFSFKWSTPQNKWPCPSPSGRIPLPRICDEPCWWALLARPGSPAGHPKVSSPMKLGHRGRTGRLLVARIGTKYLYSFIHVHSKSWKCGIYLPLKKMLYDYMTLFLKWSAIGNLISTRVEDVRVSKMCLLGTGHGRPRIDASLWVHPTTMKEPYWWIRGLLCSTISNVITTILLYEYIINNIIIYILIIVIVILFQRILRLLHVTTIFFCIIIM